MPSEFVRQIFPHNIVENEDLAVLVDQIPMDFKQKFDSRTGHLTLVIPVERGAEEIELIGNVLI